jgi:hypothetical protein
MIFSGFRVDGCAAFYPPRKSCVLARPNFGRKFAPDSIHSPPENDGVRSATLIRGLVMGPAYPPDSKQQFLDEQEYFDESPLRDEDYKDDEHSDGVTSLLEENARLRALVVRLTDLVLRSVADRG